ncbi:MAG: hypothetical protein GYA33_07685 [Thermogutta sp.]|nr:hypothetical protein [Thermogutta sp.]
MGGILQLGLVGNDGRPPIASDGEPIGSPLGRRIGYNVYDDAPPRDARQQPGPDPRQLR